MCPIMAVVVGLFDSIWSNVGHDVKPMVAVVMILSSYD